MADPQPLKYKKKTSPVEEESRSPKQSRLDMMKSLYKGGDEPETPDYVVPEEEPRKPANNPAQKIEPVSETPAPAEKAAAAEPAQPKMDSKYPIMTLDKLEAMTPEQRKAAGFSEGLFQRKSKAYSDYPITPKERFAVEPDLLQVGNPDNAANVTANTAVQSNVIPALNTQKPESTKQRGLQGMSERVRTRVEAKKAGTYWNADKTPATYWDEKSQTRKMRNETKSAPAQKETSKVKPMAYKGKGKEEFFDLTGGKAQKQLDSQLREQTNKKPNRGTPIQEAERSAKENATKDKSSVLSKVEKMSGASLDQKIKNYIFSTTGANLSGITQKNVEDFKKKHF